MTILVETRPSYHVITLNRPERLNALTLEMAEALSAALDTHPIVPVYHDRQITAL